MNTKSVKKKKDKESEVYNNIMKKDQTVQFVKDELRTDRLSHQSEKKYLQMIKDIKSGKNVTNTSSLEDLLKLLD